MSCTVAMSNSPVFSPSRSLSHVKAHSPASPTPPSPPALFLRIPKPFPDASSGPAVSPPPPSIPKRKRPARLSIPVADTSISPYGWGSPAARDVLEEERDDSGYWVACKRGRRNAMEDRYSALVGIQGDPKQAIFGVFDGHGGSLAAQFAAKNLDKNIMNEVVQGGEAAIDVEESVKHAYLKTDSDFLKNGVQGGSCCVTAFLRNGELLVSNAGDCRAVVSSDGYAEAPTSDHRPSREDERLRIEAQGGYVDLCHGVWRIQGSLAVSRGIGDSHLKKWVIAEPETKRLRIETGHEFLILASDGLWDKVPNQEAVDVARSFLRGSGKPEPMLACRKLIELSVSRGSIDDISVMLVDLKLYI